jgi:uncharacterized protein
MLPNLGVGIGYRRQLDQEIHENRAAIDWLEIVADNFLPLTSRKRNSVESLMSAYVCVPHGVDLSLASRDEPSASHLKAYVALVKLMAPPWHSDHLAYTQVDGVNLGAFMSPRRDPQTVTRVTDRVKELQDLTQTTFLLENAAASSDPGGPMSRAEFSNEIVHRADCGLLLDLANLYGDSVNFEFDPVAYLDELDLSRVVQVHIAGGTFKDGWLHDTHSRRVPEAVWSLLRILTSRVDVNGILLERDANFPPFSELTGELERARQITSEARQGDRPVLLLSGRPSGAAADETHPDRDKSIQASMGKRWDHLKTWFPASVGAMRELYGGEFDDDAAKDLVQRYPRAVADDDVLGFRAAELSRFRGLLRDLARHSPELESLIEFEAAVVELRLALDTYTGEAENGGQPDWTGPRARLELPPLVRFISLPVNAVRLKECVISGETRTFTAVREPVDLCIQISEDEVFTIYKLNAWQKAIMVAAQRRLSCRDLVAETTEAVLRPDGSALTRLDRMMRRGMVTIVDDNRDELS